MAGLAGRHESTCSRIEHGRTPPHGRGHSRLDAALRRQPDTDG
ncbi:hypothetical protein [Streptomyces sp. R35]|uniref:Uncharacterized protein n=1 Tax=Streptomyces sp. R35 TaxID=3238630 RepID=A0AB39SMC5_9ACTN